MDLFKSIGATLSSSLAVLTNELIPIGDKQVRIGVTLGEGGYAFVYRAEDINTGKAYALKRMVCQTEESKEIAKKEIKVMKKLQPNLHIIEFVGACKKDVSKTTQEFFVLMELCQGSLVDIIAAQQKGAAPSELSVCQMFKKMCLAVSVLHHHEPPIAHRDLKIENILIGKDGEPKLCDFGSCTTRAKVYESAAEICDEEEQITKYSTAMYRAPEMADLYSKQLINEKVDIWALGCLLYVLAFNIHPFQDGGNLAILSGKYRLPDRNPYSEHLQTVVKRCLQQNPVKRLNIDKLLTLVETWETSLGGQVDVKENRKRSKSPKAKIERAPEQTDAAIAGDDWDVDWDAGSGAGNGIGGSGNGNGNRSGNQNGSQKKSVGAQLAAKAAGAANKAAGAANRVATKGVAKAAGARDKVVAKLDNVLHKPAPKKNQNQDLPDAFEDFDPFGQTSPNKSSERNKSNERESSEKPKKHPSKNSLPKPATLSPKQTPRSKKAAAGGAFWDDFGGTTEEQSGADPADHSHDLVARASRSSDDWAQFDSPAPPGQSISGTWGQSGGTAEAQSHGAVEAGRRDSWANFDSPVVTPAQPKKRPSMDELAGFFLVGDPPKTS